MLVRKLLNPSMLFVPMSFQCLSRPLYVVGNQTSKNAFYNSTKLVFISNDSEYTTLSLLKSSSKTLGHYALLG
jgi:hypothetical protein